MQYTYLSLYLSLRFQLFPPVEPSGFTRRAEWVHTLHNKLISNNWSLHATHYAHSTQNDNEFLLWSVRKAGDYTVMGWIVKSKREITKQIVVVNKTNVAPLYSKRLECRVSYSLLSTSLHGKTLFIFYTISVLRNWYFSPLFLLIGTFKLKQAPID